MYGTLVFVPDADCRISAGVHALPEGQASVGEPDREMIPIG
jgi:hypothetical protein